MGREEGGVVTELGMNSTHVATVATARYLERGAPDGVLCRLVSGQFLAHRLRHAEVGDDSLALISDEINGRLQRVLRRLVGRELTSAPEQTPCCRLAKITGNIESVAHNYTQLDLFSP